jgi:hypothetical protein
LQAYERTGSKQISELSLADDVHKFHKAIENYNNSEPAMQSWRKEPFPERRYEKLSSDVICAGLSTIDERTASYELITNLPDSFIGQSYRYDDTGQSEAWMKSVVDETGSTGRTAREAATALAADEGVVRAQVSATIQSLLIAVQDKVMTQMNVLQQPELRSANWLQAAKEASSFDCNTCVLEQDDAQSRSDTHEEVATPNNPLPQVIEQPVWGIDCYTRRNITLCLETEFHSVTALTFVEKWLLPAINACPERLGHQIENACRILEGLPLASTATSNSGDCVSENVPAISDERFRGPLQVALKRKIEASAPPWLVIAANQLRRARTALGPDFFRVVRCFTSLSY